MRYKLLLAALFIIAYVSVSMAQTKLPLPGKLSEHVGDITFDKKTDDPKFKICNSANVYQYYAVNTTYKGGTKAIKNFFFSNYKFEPAFKAITGYITIRFIVNCKGQTGWFRVQQLDDNYKIAQFHKKVINELLGLTKKLNGWIPGKLDDAVRDSYYYLNFKLTGGHLKDITP
jgi:hypothetical protein